MNEQEKQIVRLLLNEMAFEGAKRHFHEPPPDIDIELFRKLERIGVPLMYDGQIEDYRYAEIEFDEQWSVFENCYRYLRIIRNNIIHANKAFRPDPSQRLSDLLSWSDELIDTVYATDSDFSARAQEIKAVLSIESF
ncbi:hypothetical protein [Pelagibius sp. Alg239-R121]|uniref:hypothetical protein n=1 Tax=Pelagibius sp. Alg239-R121 TaxID=2993448 RepID=UPI0024A776FB|nr:hypothetical protein [Pelagibius sp. Alg239-R121]